MPRLTEPRSFRCKESSSVNLKEMENLNDKCAIWKIKQYTMGLIVNITCGCSLCNVYCSDGPSTRSLYSPFEQRWKYERRTEKRTITEDKTIKTKSNVEVPTVLQQESGTFSSWCSTWFLGSGHTWGLEDFWSRVAKVGRFSTIAK